MQQIGNDDPQALKVTVVITDDYRTPQMDFLGSESWTTPMYSWPELGFSISSHTSKQEPTIVLHVHTRHP